MNSIGDDFSLSKLTSTEVVCSVVPKFYGNCSPTNDPQNPIKILPMIWTNKGNPS